MARKQATKSKRQTKATKEAPPQEPRPVLVWTAWSILFACLLVVVLSLASYDPADRPTFTVDPPNETTQNLAGPVGATIAHGLYRTLGYPAWILVLGLISAASFALSRVRVDQWILRTLGLVVAASSAAGLNAILLTNWRPMPGLTGGVIGEASSASLVQLFGTAGSLVFLLTGLGIGLAVSAGEPIYLAAKWLWTTARPNAARSLAGMRSSTGRLVESLKSPPQQAAVRIDDLDGETPGEDPEELEDTELSEPAAAPVITEPKPQKKPRKQPKPRKQRKPKKPATESDDLDTEELDLEQDAAVEALGTHVDEPDEPTHESELDDEEEEDDAPGAPQIFDRDKLREKVAALPVRFSTVDKQSATDDDLQDLQNVEDLEGYRFPGLDLLAEPEANFSEKLEETVRDGAEALEAALTEFRIKGEVVGIESGPVITLYHIKLAPGTRVSVLQKVASDIARSLKAVNIRIVPNMAGRDTVGVEVPNQVKEKVRLKELMAERERFEGMNLPMFLGKDASGEPLIEDLTKMPHMLIAGTTGSGKSVCMNAIIMSFMYARKPNELKLVLVDPKMVEMSQFKDIPHLMSPVVTEMSKAAAILEWAVKKMDERYELLAEAGVRDISGYNELTWEELKETFNPASEQEEARIPRRLPYMVFIIDELADLMMTNKEVEGSIIRIAQKARAVGIHLILATQRPQANVVTGLIKGNMPCRIAFKVASGLDSRIVLDQKGGELLLGMGDMLFLSPRSHKLARAQGTLVDDKEIRRVVRFMRDVASPTFERQLVQLRSGADIDEESDEARILRSQNNSSASLKAAQEDPMFDRAVEIVLETKRGSVSLLQRRLAIGYTRASRLVDLMGIAGIISDHKGSVARDVLISPEEWAEMKRIAGEMQPGLFDEGDPTAQTISLDEPDPLDAEPETEIVGDAPWEDEQADESDNAPETEEDAEPELESEVEQEDEPEDEDESEHEEELIAETEDDEDEDEEEEAEQEDESEPEEGDESEYEYEDDTEDEEDEEDEETEEEDEEEAGEESEDEEEDDYEYEYEEEEDEEEEDEEEDEDLEEAAEYEEDEDAEEDDLEDVEEGSESSELFAADDEDAESHSPRT